MEKLAHTDTVMLMFLELTNNQAAVLSAYRGERYIFMITRINITIDDELLNKIDSYAKKRYLSRSGLIAFVLSTYLDVAVTDPDAFKLTPDFVEV